MEFTGDGIEGTLVDGVLTARGKNKVRHFALVGHGHEGDLVLPLNEIETVDVKQPSLMKNGVIDVRSTAGKRYQLIFQKKKHGEDFARLHQALEAARA